MIDYASLRRTMVDTQVRPSDVTKFPIIDAMLRVPREAFVPDGRLEAAYADTLVDLGDGRTMLDARVLAKMLDALDIQPGEVVLDVGFGLGYSTAVAAHLAEFVVGVEDDAGRVEDAEAACAAQGIDNAAFFEAELTEGVPKSGPFDVIMLQGAFDVFPDALLAQLKDGGRIGAIQRDGSVGVAKVGLNSGGSVTWRPVFDAVAPLLPGFEERATFSL